MHVFVGCQFCTVSTNDHLFEVGCILEIWRLEFSKLKAHSVHPEEVHSTKRQAVMFWFFPEKETWHWHWLLGEEPSQLGNLPNSWKKVYIKPTRDLGLTNNHNPLGISLKKNPWIFMKFQKQHHDFSELFQPSGPPKRSPAGVLECYHEPWNPTGRCVKILVGLWLIEFQSYYESSKIDC